MLVSALALSATGGHGDLSGFSPWVADAGRPCAAAALWSHAVTVKSPSDVFVPARTPIAVVERQLILATLDQFEGDKKTRG
jgi:hypothetical protein